MDVMKRHVPFSSPVTMVTHLLPHIAVILHKFIHGVEYFVCLDIILLKRGVYVWLASPSSGLVFVCRNLISQTMKEEGKWLVSTACT